MALIEEVTEMGAGEVGELYGSFAERLEQTCVSTCARPTR